jgi:hypothetical protein
MEARRGSVGGTVGSPPKAQLVAEECFTRSGGGVKGLLLSKTLKSGGSSDERTPEPSFGTLGLSPASRGGVSDSGKSNAGCLVFGEAMPGGGQDDGMRSRGSSASSQASMFDLAQRLRANSLDGDASGSETEGGLTPSSVAAEYASLEALMCDGFPVQNAKFRRRRRRSILGPYQEEALMAAGHSPHAFQALEDDCTFEMEMDE